MKHTEFWARIEQQIIELRSARTVADAIRILQPVDPSTLMEGELVAGRGIFQGSGGDLTVRSALAAAGWTVAWSKASYHYAMQPPGAITNWDMLAFDDMVADATAYRGEDSDQDDGSSSECSDCASPAFEGPCADHEADAKKVDAYMAVAEKLRNLVDRDLGITYVEGDIYPTIHPIGND